MNEELRDIAAEINRLSVPAQLRLAASLLEQAAETKRFVLTKTAYTIIDKVSTELGAAIVLSERRGR